MSKFIKLSVTYRGLYDETKKGLEKPDVMIFNTDCIKRVEIDTTFSYPKILIQFADLFENYLVHNETINSLYEKLRK